MGALLSAILRKAWRSGGVTKRTPRSWQIFIFAGLSGTNRDISNETWRSGGVILWHLISWQFALDANYDPVPKIATFQTKRDDLKLRSLDRDISNETWRSRASNITKTWRSQAQISGSWHFKWNVTISGLRAWHVKRNLTILDPIFVWNFTISDRNQIITCCLTCHNRGTRIISCIEC